MGIVILKVTLIAEESPQFLFNPKAIDSPLLTLL